MALDRADRHQGLMLLQLAEYQDELQEAFEALGQQLERQMIEIVRTIDSS
jgi:hypothetical protein